LTIDEQYSVSASSVLPVDRKGCSNLCRFNFWTPFGIFHGRSVKTQNSTIGSINYLCMLIISV